MVGGGIGEDGLEVHHWVDFHALQFGERVGDMLIEQNRGRLGNDASIAEVRF